MCIRDRSNNATNNNNGSATVVASGGTPNYSYLWSNGVSGNSINNLTPGTYTVTATDASNCTASQSVVITNFISSNLSIEILALNHVSCFGGDDGVAVVSASGGSGNYSYLWNNGATGTTAFNLTVGNYSVTVNDGATSTSIALSITEPPQILINISSTNASSNNNGSAIAVASGGTPDYSYLWSNGESSNSIDNLSAGTYTVTVSDEANCVATESVVITDLISSNLSLTILSVTNVSCFGGNDGMANVSADGGNGNYSYLWSNGAIGATISNLEVGNYTVTATDGSSTGSVSVTISSPPQLIVQVLGTNAMNGNNGSAMAVVEGGTQPYLFLWSNGATTSSINNLIPGTYSVTVIDDNDCEEISSVETVSYTHLTLPTTPYV